MKRILITIGLAFSIGIIYGQDITSEIDFYQSAYGLEKKGIVENFMNLSGEKDASFWEVYNAYEVDRKEIGKARINNLNTYSETYESMTDEQADDISKKMLSNRASQEKLYKSYYGKMKKVLGAKGALQFLELEVYLQTSISYAIMESIPFIGEQ